MLDGLTSEHDDLRFAMGLLEEATLPEHRRSERERVLDFCRRHPDALYRSCLGGHLTGSGFVVDPEARTVLLIHHNKLGLWLQPGGHADGEGNLALVARNEVAEETGLDGLHPVLPAFDVDVHEIPARGDVPGHFHLDLRFIFTCSRERTVTAKLDEVADARWFSLDELADVAGPAVVEPAGRAVRLLTDGGRA